VKKTIAILLAILMLFSLLQGILRENDAKADEDTSKWVPINKGLPKDTEVYSVTIDPKNTKTIYAGTYDGVFKSINGGESWTQINTGLSNKEVLSFAIDPKNTNVIYAGTGRDGVYRSTNGGKNWVQMSNGLMNIAEQQWISIHSFAIDPENTQTLYTGVWGGQSWGGGIFKSTNGGESWSQTINGLSKTVINGLLTPVDIKSLTIDPKNTNVIYAGTWGGGVFKSTNKGINWTRISGIGSWWVYCLAIDPKNTQTIYTGTNSGIFKSTDSGKSWIKINTGLLDSDVEVYSLAINPVNTQIIYSGTGDVFKSINGGKKWTRINAGLTDTEVDSIAIDPKNTETIYAGTLNGIFKLTSETASKTVIVLRIGKSTFTVNGISNTLDSPPVIKNSRTLLPIRAIIESLGGTVGWDPQEKKVTVTLGSTTIELWIGKSTAKINGINTAIDATNSKVVPEIINSRTMLPLRFVTENLGCDVHWDGTTKTITITYGG
jgi:photosystem II stability/assembly factor-like uncharacterized protein